LVAETENTFSRGGFLMVVSKFKTRLIIVLAAALVTGFAGCTKKPSQEEVTKLDEAKSAAESAEKKLSELRRERMDLEEQLNKKEGELKTKEQERDELKSKMGK
jgi:septal ring factor EnvC (AmiA/AmiB activator)